MTSWPRNDAEAASIADKLAQLAKTPFAAIYIEREAGEIRDREKPRIAFRLSGQLGSRTLGREVVEDFLRRQISRTREEVLQIEVPPENVPWSGLNVRQLTIASVSDEVRAEDVEGEAAIPGGICGWLVVGSESRLGAKEETMVLAAAQRLSELARVLRLEHSIQLRSQFLSIASHELKTPLTSIYGILQLQQRMIKLKKDHAVIEPQDQKRSYLKILLRQVERLNELIDGLLDVSRIQNGRFAIEPSDVDVATLVRDTIQSRLSLIATEAGVKLHVEAPQSLMAAVDPVRMEEVVTNLVMNAIRFSPEGGVVSIRLFSDSDSFRISVRDQGPSLPLEDRERIFQPFERAQRTSRLGGLGLGLYISRQIALLHGGNVSLIESVPGRGNVIEAYFPIRHTNVISA